MRVLRYASSAVLVVASCFSAAACSGDAEVIDRTETEGPAVAPPVATPGYGMPLGQPAVPLLKGPDGKLARITVRPEVATPTTRPRVEIENIVDRPLGRGNYHVNLTGPGGEACDKALRWDSGYHPRTNRSKTVRATLRTVRTGTHPGFNRGKSWCPGKFEVFVEFRDFSVVETGRSVPLGRVYFRVVE